MKRVAFSLVVTAVLAAAFAGCGKDGDSKVVQEAIKAAEEEKAKEAEKPVQTRPTWDVAVTQKGHLDAPPEGLAWPKDPDFAPEFPACDVLKDLVRGTKDQRKAARDKFKKLGEELKVFPLKASVGTAKLGSYDGKTFPVEFNTRATKVCIGIQMPMAFVDKPGLTVARWKGAPDFVLETISPETIKKNKQAEVVSSTYADAASEGVWKLAIKVHPGQANVFQQEHAMIDVHMLASLDGLDKHAKDHDFMRGKIYAIRVYNTTRKQLAAHQLGDLLYDSLAAGE